MNYRVGLFGFLNANTESCPGNMGLHDQLVAIKWIKENIKVFGGDPNQITLFGESAGAMSIGGHLVSPLSRGLFTRAILQSGSLYGPIVKGSDSHSGRSKVREISKRVGCFNDEEVDIESMVNCLKTVPAEELLEVAKQKRGDFRPVFGDDYIPIDPNEAFKTGSFQNVELLIGANMDEGSHFFPSMFPQIFDRHKDETVDITKESAAVYMKIIFQNFPDVESEVVARFYLQNVSADDHVSIRKALYDSFGDYLILCPAVHVAEHVARYQGNVYFYFFTHRPSNSGNGKWMGVSHLEEVQFVFGVPLRRRHEYTEDELRFSTSVMDVWLTFARRGKPPSVGNVPWLSYSIKDHYYVDLNDQQFTVKKGPHEKSCIFWRTTL
ncbi:acetylcholinesterase-1-like [Tachypleus tridentatus]|uniref:acetylcholinesterase-1-like n=1 Tax=Tachypleus tridentatus TaxID=6853 RepID=UPI003FD279A2